MSEAAGQTDGRDLVERLARGGAEDRGEGSLVASPGARTVAWAIKVKSHASYNVYNVRAVSIGDAGSAPVEFGVEVEAVNLAESFLNPGTLSAGTYALMARVGDRNVFYAVP